jgi:hypothetical protein
VEGAFLSGQALAAKVQDVHAAYVPTDFTIAPTKRSQELCGIDHSDRWNYGDWPDLDVEEMCEKFHWNGRPVTKRAARTVFARPHEHALTLGRPLTKAVHTDDCDESFANWITKVGVDPSSRPPSTHQSNFRAGVRIIKSDDRYDFLALPSRPGTQAEAVESTSPRFGAPAPPSRPGTRGVLKVCASCIQEVKECGRKPGRLVVRLRGEGKGRILSADGRRRAHVSVETVVGHDTSLSFIRFKLLT